MVSANLSFPCVRQCIDRVLRSRGTECFDRCRALRTDYWSGWSWVRLEGKCFCDTPRGNIWDGSDLTPIFIRLNGCYGPVPQGSIPPLFLPFKPGLPREEEVFPNLQGI